MVLVPRSISVLSTARETQLCGNSPGKRRKRTRINMWSIVTYYVDMNWTSFSTIFCPCHSLIYNTSHDLKTDSFWSCLRRRSTPSDHVAISPLVHLVFVPKVFKLQVVSFDLQIFTLDQRPRSTNISAGRPPGISDQGPPTEKEKCEADKQIAIILVKDEQCVR